MLQELSDYGWKPAGSYNCEELTRNRILKELNDIRSQNQNVENLRFDIDTQYVSGCFDIPAHDTEGMNICYRNVGFFLNKNNIQSQFNLMLLLVGLKCDGQTWKRRKEG